MMKPLLTSTFQDHHCLVQGQNKGGLDQNGSKKEIKEL